VNKYDIAARADGAGFDVRVVSANGARQTVLGFATESAAQHWIAQDQRLARTADPFDIAGGRSGNP
jgi:hypothetical protein